MTKIGFVGSGKMATALAKAMVKAKIAHSKDIIASDKNDEQLAKIRKEINIRTAKDNREAVKNADIVFLAVKPQDIGNVLDEIKKEIKNQLMVSIAAGITLDFLESKLPKARIIRVMPNTPCLVGEMAAGYALGKKCNEKDRQVIKRILSAAGIAIEMEEKLLDAVTGLSGSGPAFVAYLIEALAEGGVKAGLSKEVAEKLTVQTFKGTAKLLQDTKISPKELIDMVSSPNGTTIAGRAVLEKSDVKGILTKTVEAAAKRSKELGR